jgi:hypothetical protein
MKTNNGSIISCIILYTINLLGLSDLLAATTDNQRCSDSRMDNLVMRSLHHRPVSEGESWEYTEPLQQN